MSQTHPPCYASLQRLLAPASLARASGRAGAHDRIRREAITGGLSGARIERLTLEPATARGAQGAAADTEAHAAATSAFACILKHLDPRTNWLMRASGDDRCREVALTQSRLWERLPDEIWLPVLACARMAGGAGALLLPDLSAELCSAAKSYGPADGALLAGIVEGLAALHATFWGDRMLRRHTWLTAPADALLALTPARLRAATVGLAHADANYATQASARWALLPRLIEADDAAALARVVAAPERVVAALAAAPTTLVHGDPWLANLGEHDGRLILLDWALCTAGPATFDSLWLANTWRALDPDATLAHQRAALRARGVADVADDALWALLCDLGWLRSTLMGLESLVDDAVRDSSPVPRAEAIGRLRLWCGRAASILRRRGW